MKGDAEGFFDRLRHARESAGLTKGQVAKAAGVSHSTYHRYEAEDSEKRAFPKYDTLIKLAQALGKSIDWLVSGEDFGEVGPRLPPLSEEAMEVARLFDGCTARRQVRLMSFASVCYRESQDEK